MVVITTVAWPNCKERINNSLNRQRWSKRFPKCAQAEQCRQRMTVPTRCYCKGELWSGSSTSPRTQLCPLDMEAPTGKSKFHHQLPGSACAAIHSLTIRNRRVSASYILTCTSSTIGRNGKNKLGKEWTESKPRQKSLWKRPETTVKILGNHTWKCSYLLCRL